VRWVREPSFPTFHIERRGFRSGWYDP